MTKSVADKITIFAYISINLQQKLYSRGRKIIPVDFGKKMSDLFFFFPSLSCVFHLSTTYLYSLPLHLTNDGSVIMGLRVNSLNIHLSPSSVSFLLAGSIFSDILLEHFFVW